MPPRAKPAPTPLPASARRGSRRSLADATRDDDAPSPTNTPPLVRQRRDSDPPTLRPCTHCLSVLPRSSDSDHFKCDSCEMISDLPFNHEMNVDARRRRDLRAGALTLPSGVNAVAAATNTPDHHEHMHSSSSFNLQGLTKMDRALRAAADEGAPFPRFNDTTPLSVDEAIEIVRGCISGLNFMAPSTHAIALIQSGKATTWGHSRRAPMPRLLLRITPMKLHSSTEEWLTYPARFSNQ